ncbi:Uncharacterised protein [Streptococcus pneumoniae]|nr:Uncharacterised protein [Streptococcus pneumoniae]
MGNLWNFRRVLLYSLSGVFGLDYLYAFDTGRESCTHLVCNTIKIASARYLARQEKLPALFSLCYFGDFFSSVFFLSLCRILKCYDSNYFTVY